MKNPNKYQLFKINMLKNFSFKKHSKIEEFFYSIIFLCYKISIIIFQFNKKNKKKS